MAWYHFWKWGKSAPAALGPGQRLQRIPPPPPLTQAPPRPPEVAPAAEPPLAFATAKVDVQPSSVSLVEIEPYQALLGAMLDPWGIVEVVGETKHHVAVRELPEKVAVRIGLGRVESVVAIERKLVVTHTKGFASIPKEHQLEDLAVVEDNLRAYVEEMQERAGYLASIAANKRDLKADLKELEKEYKEHWREEVGAFRRTILPDRLKSVKDDQAWEAAQQKRPSGPKRR